MFCLLVVLLWFFVSIVGFVLGWFIVLGLCVVVVCVCCFVFWFLGAFRNALVLFDVVVVCFGWFGLCLVL